MQHDMRNGKKDGGWKMSLWMVVCCIPMIAIVVLPAVGVWKF